VADLAGIAQRFDVVRGVLDERSRRLGSGGKYRGWKRHSAERAAKGFSCRAQLVAMLFFQLAHADSLRDICNGLACCMGKLVHLGISVAPNIPTLSYANRHRPAKLYEDLFYTALARFRDDKGLGERKRKFRFKNKLLSLDSTTISRVF
jgi:hypothetical protein